MKPLPSRFYFQVPSHKAMALGKGTGVSAVPPACDNNERCLVGSAWRVSIVAIHSQSSYPFAKSLELGLVSHYIPVCVKGLLMYRLGY